MSTHPTAPGVHPLVAQTLLLARADPRAGREITEAAGVAHTSLNNWSKGKCGATIVSLNSVLQALGYQLKVVPLGRAKAPRVPDIEKVFE